MTTKNWIQKNTRSLAGKTVAVSGSTGGIGRQLCAHLCDLGADLILLDRSRERSVALGESLRAAHPSLKVSYITVDLEDMGAVRSAAEELLRRGVDFLILNAGAYHIPRHRCDTGYDNVFMINFVSPYYLARRLLPHVASRGGRVVAVGSIAHGYSRTDPDDIDFSTRKKSSKVYGNAKRYLMFSLLGLREHRDSVSVTHPGITLTNITAHYPKLIFAIIKHPMKVIFMSPRRASLCILAGIFDQRSDGNCWTGPGIFNVWGTPKLRPLSTCTEGEAARIRETAEEILGRVETENR
ncbi:MAG: SDR family NAD(P)-dependent oxidoreductase [Clostridia bacterium]|nr:SDR family NAD(P)-dependent oxidoreductase [Clostridia bacterium]